MSLHDKIMHIGTAGDERDGGAYRNGWVHGRQSMRHAAAELAAPYDALIEQMAAALEGAKRVWDYYRCDADRTVLDALVAVESALAAHAKVAKS
jgi:arginase family enzyme